MQLKPVDCELWKLGCNGEARYFFQSSDGHLITRCVKHIGYQPNEGEKILSRAEYEVARLLET